MVKKGGEGAGEESLEGVKGEIEIEEEEEVLMS